MIKQRAIYFLFYLILLPFLAFSQLEEVKRVAVDADKFYIDRLENYYFQKNNAITRHDKNFKPIATYDSKTFGNISFIDVSNPFKTQIFYKEFNCLIFLDNYMAELRTPIIIDDLELYNVDVACSSSRGGFWVYDNQTSQAVLVDSDLVKVQQGVNLYSVVKSSFAKSIIESNNFIFLLFDSGQVIILDKFGSFYKDINYLNVKYLDVLNDIAYFITDSHLEIYKTETSEIFSYPLPDIDIEDFQISLENIVFLSKGNIIYFRIK